MDLLSGKYWAVPSGLEGFPAGCTPNPIALSVSTAFGAIAACAVSCSFISLRMPGGNFDINVPTCASAASCLSDFGAVLVSWLGDGAGVRRFGWAVFVW